MNTRWRVMPYACGDSILTCGEIAYQSFGLDKKRTKRLLRSFFGCGTRIRTLTIRVRVVGAAVTQFRNELTFNVAIIFYCMYFVKHFLKS